MPALTFRPTTTKRGSGSFHLCRDHPSGNGSGRWRVAIAGHPVLDSKGSVLVVCDKCRDRLLGVYGEALDGVPELVAA